MQGRMRIGNVELYSELHAGSGTPRAFLNGIAMSTAHWTPLREHLIPGTDLLHDFKDQLRSGRADAGYSIESHADELALLMGALKLPAADLIGTSYGSEVAMIFAIKYPERCRSLVLIDGVSESDARLKAAVKSWKAAALTDGRCFYKSIIPWNYSPHYIEANAAMLAEREDALASLPQDYFEGFARLCDAFLELNVTGRLHEIVCPTLVLVGELDILKPVEFSRIIHAGIAGSQMATIPGAGHATVIEDPSAVADQINPFLRALEYPPVGTDRPGELKSVHIRGRR
ncbi:MAG TPA: alpha/beta fold hydrolase [Spirochaetia bacterium]|nr:alpha/beta fold hydrolase [Spirochaetia bacterium]